MLTAREWNVREKARLWSAPVVRKTTSGNCLFWAKYPTHPSCQQPQLETTIPSASQIKTSSQNECCCVCEFRNSSMGINDYVICGFLVNDDDDDVLVFFFSVREREPFRYKAIGLNNAPKVKL
jgi:hypothetical protein